MSSDSHSVGELELRLRQACAELERRLRGGETEVAQQLLAGDPEIAANEDVAVELIYTEFVTLEEMGAKPSLNEVLDRFPQWRERLERLLKVHDVFRDDVDFDLKLSSDTVAGLDSTCDGASARTERDDTPTRRWIGQYELLEEVDRGGSGIVYRARQKGLNRIVAVKSIRSADASESERARFRAEAESAAKLQHPNIVQVHEVGDFGLAKRMITESATLPLSRHLPKASNSTTPCRERPRLTSSGPVFVSISDTRREDSRSGKRAKPPISPQWQSWKS